MPNPFDQFDPPQANPFDQFDPKPTPKGHEGPPDLFVGPVTRAISAIPGALERAGKHAKDLMTGEIPPTPENVLPAASLAIGASPVKLGLGSVTYAPKVRPPIATTADELRDAATMAVTRPTGSVVPQAEAGAAVRRGASTQPPPPSVDEWLTQAGPIVRPPTVDDWIRGGPIPDWIAGVAKPAGERGPWGTRVAEAATEAPSARARMITQGRIPDENIVAHLVDEAVQGKHATLSHFRKTTPTEDWAKVQGASLGYLGRTGELGGEIGFDAITMLQRYKAIPEREKGILFGQPTTVAGQKLQAGLRPHLDSLVADADRLGRLATSSGEAVQLPLEILPRILGVGTEALLRYMGHGGTAAAVARWSREFARVIEKGKTPAAIAALTLATRNLENTIGSAEAADTKSIADINKPLPEEEEARRRIRERAGEPQRAGETLAGAARSVAPILDKLPYEKMRQSRNVYPLSENASRRVNLPPEIKDRFLSDLVQDPMAVAAGMQDLLTPAERKLLGRH